MDKDELKVWHSPNGYHLSKALIDEIYSCVEYCLGAAKDQGTDKDIADLEYLKRVIEEELL